MLHRILILLTVSLGLAFPAVAQDADEQAFLNYQVAMAINDKCHFLRQFELSHTYPIFSDLVDQLHWGAAYGSGKISPEEYDASLTEVRNQAATIAQTIACTDEQQAAAYIVPLRAELALAIYARLLIAFELGQPTPEQQDAARRYEAMIAPLYGQNWQGFVQRAQADARQILDEARQTDSMDDLYGFSLFPDDDWLWPEEDSGYGPGSWNVEMEAAGSVRIIDEIFFEIVAESQGYRYVTRSEPGRDGYIKSLTNAEFEPQADLFGGPGRYPTLEGGAEVHAAMTIGQDGSIRIMTYGQGAAMLKQGTVVLMVQPDPLPADKADNYSYVTTREWWDTARAYRGEVVPETCLGGPCFAFDPSLAEALLTGDRQQTLRFYIAQAGDAAPPSFDDVAIQLGYAYQIRSRRDFLAAAP
ncbi:MAG: hypothetical protein KIT02_10630 [Devosia sp.]|uniref:hypothetical protein n=1 Tax=Devosia sp. TaxID=1871048 RepID=UPI0024C53E4F|nr:hypothetical protein [Devosia sp.]UYN98413.1 MAG: hypothetical protein KIT02_10630 [Devosia sp.]